MLRASRCFRASVTAVRQPAVGMRRGTPPSTRAMRRNLWSIGLRSSRRRRGYTLLWLNKKGMGWKELWGGIARIMQDYCGEYKQEETLRLGLRWIGEIREREAAEAAPRNPHELVRTLECFTRLTAGEIIMHASLARKASSAVLDFRRPDFPDLDPEEWNKFITLRLVNGGVKVDTFRSGTGSGHRGHPHTNKITKTTHACRGKSKMTVGRVGAAQGAHRERRSRVYYGWFSSWSRRLSRTGSKKPENVKRRQV